MIIHIAKLYADKKDTKKDNTNKDKKKKDNKTGALIYI